MQKRELIKDEFWYWAAATPEWTSILPYVASLGGTATDLTAYLVTTLNRLPSRVSEIRLGFLPACVPPAFSPTKTDVAKAVVALTRPTAHSRIWQAWHLSVHEHLPARELFVEAPKGYKQAIAAAVRLKQAKKRGCSPLESVVPLQNYGYFGKNVEMLCQDCKTSFVVSRFAKADGTYKCQQCHRSTQLLNYSVMNKDIKCTPVKMSR